MLFFSSFFYVEYIKSHSVSSQPSNSKCIAKPKFDARLYNVMLSIIMAKFPTASKSDITKKIQAVQKKYTLKDKKIDLK